MRPIPLFVAWFQGGNGGRSGSGDGGGGGGVVLGLGDVRRVVLGFDGVRRVVFGSAVRHVVLGSGVRCVVFGPGGGVRRVILGPGQGAVVVIADRVVVAVRRVVLGPGVVLGSDVGVVRRVVLADRVGDGVLVRLRHGRRRQQAADGDQRQTDDLQTRPFNVTLCPRRNHQRPLTQIGLR